MEVSGRSETPRKNIYHENIQCQPCQGEGDEVSAEGYCENCNEYFCSSCLRVHRKLAVTKNHVLKCKDQMPKTKVKINPSVEPCSIHKSEIIRYYCYLHDSVGCGDCMITDHKSCKVGLVSDVAADFSNSREITMIKRKMGEIERRISYVKEEMKGNFKFIAKMKAKVVQEIKLYRIELNSYLDQAEAELLNEVEQLNTKDVAMQNNYMKECDSIEAEIKHFQEKIKQYETKINPLFVTVKLAQKKMETCQESVISFSSAATMNSSTFEPSKDIQALKASHSLIGKLAVVTKPCFTEQKRRIMDMEAQYVGELNVQGEQEAGCTISGMAMLSCEEILLADGKSKCLKIFNLLENKITSTYITSPPERPWDVTVINAHKNAATLPDVGKILLINTKNGLSGAHCLKVRTNCRGICSIKGTLVVSFDSPASIQILDMKGYILCSVKDTRMLSFPGHLVWSKYSESIYVSEFTKKTVCELTAEGQLKATYKSDNLKGPRGLTVTSDGTVVVCSENDSDKVSIMVQNDTEMLPLYVSNVQRPMSLLFCEDSNKMYISEHSTPYIKTFDLKPRNVHL
ncbi:uncharacterized protein LOC123525760 [Mercenaria mercenaria]|uniref:uncharacterized protein LOC123525760 n=1 Tax=Mercenaria mercenaria TaxID=6596 RepID=UPI00234E4BCF|nr:uncharacterized protein LOC123525760 [Mercenaria mercenaria]